MTGQAGLIAQDPKYCIDTNVIVSFMRGTDDEHYGADVFPDQWRFLEAHMQQGDIVAPRKVEEELGKWHKTIKAMPAWLTKHQYLFCDIESDIQLELAKRITCAYEAYALSENYLGDLEVMSLAGARKLTVISLESSKSTPSKSRPKIPDVCKEFGIDCVSLPGFLRREGFGTSEMAGVATPRSLLGLLTVGES